jgi:hypothetical protein
MTAYRSPEAPREGTTRSSPLARLFALWFGLRAPVGRAAYFASGVGLMLLKYGLDAALVYAVTKRVWSPASYLAPSLILHQESIGTGAPALLYAALGVMTLPFAWIGVSMSVRRAADAGISPWNGLGFLIPIVNYVVMILLAIVPSRKGEPGWIEEPPPSSVRMEPGVKPAVLAVLVNVVQALAMTAIGVYGLKSYGAVLFFGTPCVMGATAAVIYNRPQTHTLGQTVLIALLGTFAAGLAILLVAIEGILCLAMAFPIAAALGIIGAMIGWAIGTHSRGSATKAAFVLVALPGAAGIESKVASPTLHEVETVIEIDAPPEAVWPNVVGFAELPPPPEWFFRLGIAYPMRARIEGEGAGAVRRCEFSTGPFVEPITRWEPPSRLSFNVAAQPPSMKEWSPYAHVNAPHLEGYMVSRRGEFRLIALPGGRTRLEGSTWYTLAIYPEGYWVGYADALLHAIHGRVLTHIKSLSERKE